MAVFTKNIKLEFLSASDKIEKWAEPINDNLIKIDALGTEIVAAMLPFAQLREAIEKNAGTSVDSTSIFFPDNIKLPDVGDGVKRRLTYVVTQIANNKMSFDNPAVRTGAMQLLSGQQSMPAIKFGNVYDTYVSGGNLVFAKSGVVQMQLVANGARVPETDGFNSESVVNVQFLKQKGLQPSWAGNGLRYTGAPTQYLEVIGNELKAIKVDPQSGVEMTWDSLVDSQVIKLDDFMIIQDPITKAFKVTTKLEFLGGLVKKNYGTRYDPTTGSVVGDPLNTVLNPAGPSVPDGEYPGNVEYVISKNGTFAGKPVYAGQSIYWDVTQQSWKLKAEYVRLTSFTGDDGVTIVGDMTAGYGQYSAGLIQLDTAGMEAVDLASVSVQAGIKDLDAKKFNKNGGVIAGDITVDNIDISTGGSITIPTAAVNDTDAINKIYADAKFALVRGDKLNVFRVATPVGDDDAVPKKYMNTLVQSTVSGYYTKLETDSMYALKAGNLLQAFAVAKPIADEHAVNKKFVVDSFAEKQGNGTLTFKASAPVSDTDVVNKKYMEENVISGQSAGAGLLFTPGTTGVAPKMDVDVVNKMGLGFDAPDESGKLMIDYPALDTTLQVKPGDFIMVYDEVSGQILKVKKDDFLGTLTQSLRLRGSWNPATNVITGDTLNQSLVSGSVTINTFSKTQAYPIGSFVYYAPLQPNWALGNAYSKGDKVTYNTMDYVANDNIPANTAFVEGSSGATWSYIDLYETYKAKVAVSAGAFNATQWTRVAYNGTGPIGLAGDNTAGFSYQVQIDGQYDLNGNGNVTTLLAGDQIVWTGTAWILVPDSQAVKSVFGRTGPVIAAAGDYKAEQVQYIRVTGKADIQAATADVLKALNDLDDRKVSTTRTQTIAGNKSFSGATTFTAAPKVPSKPLTPADDDLITKAYVSKVLADNEYITRVYSTVVGKPINWQIGQQTIGLTGQVVTAGAWSEIILDGISQAVIKGGQSLQVRDTSKLILGDATTTDTDVAVLHFKGKYDLQSTAHMDASGKINIKYTPTDDDDAVPKKWVEDKITASQTGYTRAEADDKFYLKEGGDVGGWGSFKQSVTEQYALTLKNTTGDHGLRFSTTSADVCTIVSGTGKHLIETTSQSVRIQSQVRPIYLDAFAEFKLGARLVSTQMLQTMGTIQQAGDSNIAFTNKVIGGKLYAGLWGHTMANTYNNTSANITEDNQFLINSGTWTLRSKRFDINTVEGAHCAVVPTLDTHLVNKKFLDQKVFVDAGPADTKQYVRKNQGWSELIIAAPSYWTLPDLPQKLKDIVADQAANVDTQEQKFFQKTRFHIGSVGQDTMVFMSGNRATPGSELLSVRASSATEAQLRASTGLSLLCGIGGVGDLRLACDNTSQIAQFNSAGEIRLELTGNNSKNITINADSGAKTGTKYTNIILKGGKGGTDVRGFKLVGNDAGSTSLEFNPGHSILDGSAGKQMQIIPEGAVADAFYYDSTNTRWNFRKIPRMASVALNVAPTAPEEFVTKKYLDEATAGVSICPGLEGQVYTMGASTWSGKYPQYMGTVKEAQAINKIKIDDDTSTTGKISIIGQSAGTGSAANTSKQIDIVIEGTGLETQANSRNILINNRSALGQIDLQARGAVNVRSLTQKTQVIGTQVNIDANGAGNAVTATADRFIFANRTKPSVSVNLETALAFSDAAFPNIIDNSMVFAPQNSNPSYWQSLGVVDYRGQCFWDELAVVGISQSNNNGVLIQAVPDLEWKDPTLAEQVKRVNRNGSIKLKVPKIGTATQPASLDNGISLITENANGGIYLHSKGTAGGTLQFQTGTNVYTSIAVNTATVAGNKMTFACGGDFQARAAGSVSIESNLGFNFATQTGATGRQGMQLVRTSTPNDCFKGGNPATGSNIILGPYGSGSGYNGNNVQLGSPSAASLRFAGVFARGLDIGEGGSLSTTSSVTGRGIALVGSTPKWAAAQTAQVSDNYPRGGLLIGVRGDGAETTSDSRHIQIINESKLGRIDILAVPNAANVNDSIINIMQGKSVAAQTANGIYIRASTKVEVSGAQVEVKNLVTPVAGTDAANKDYVDGTFVAKTGDTMTGVLSFSDIDEGVRFTALNSGTGIYNGTGDAATQDKTNLQIKSWQGIGISPTAGLPANMTMGQNSIWINARSGAINSIGVVTANGFRSTEANAYWGDKSGHGMTLGMSTDNRTIIGGGGSDGIVVVRPLGTGSSTAQTIFEASGTIWNPIAPTNTAHLTNKAYVDSAIAAGDALQVSKSGDTMTGNLTVPAVNLSGSQSSAPNTVTRKDYVDGEIAKQVAKTGGSISGEILFTGNGLSSGLRFLPTGSNDAFGIRCVNPDLNTGELEFYSTDDDVEPFVFRHYTAGANGSGTSVEWVRIDNEGLKVKGNLVYHPGNKPTPADIGALQSGETAVAATKLATARTIGGVAFDGTANINLPGVNTAGNQSTTGNAATATKLATARTIAGVAFDGTANISLTAANVGAIATTGGTATGNITAPDFIQSSTQSTNAAACTRKDYVDSAIAAGDALQVSKSGDTMTGGLKVNAEIQSVSYNSYRQVIGDYGTFWRNDGTNHYLMLTNIGDPYGTYNSLRPLRIQLSTGKIYLGTDSYVNNDAQKIFHDKYAPRITQSEYLDTGSDLNDMVMSTGGMVVSRFGFNVANRPPVGSSANTILGFNPTGGYKHQIAFTDGGTIYSRYNNNVSWSNWGKVYTDIYRPTPAEVGAVNKTGDTMTGNLTTPKVLVSGAQGTESNALTRKDYVDTRIIISAADPLPTDGVDGQIWFKYE